MDKKKTLTLIIAGVAVAILVGLVALSGGRDSGPDQTGGDSRKGKKGGGFFDFLGGGDTNEEPLSPKQVLLKQAEEYRRRADYPPSSNAIKDGDDPVVKDFVAPQMEARPHADNKPVPGPHLVHYVAGKSFDPDQPLLLHAFLTDDGKKKLPMTDAKAYLTIGGMNGRVLATAPFRDDGSTGDRAGDGIYTASFAFPTGERKRVPGNFTVIIKVTTDAGEISATNMFNVGSLGIRHAGTFRDKAVTDAKGKHLAIEADFDVQDSSEYHIQGSIYDSAGKAIGWAQSRRRLAPGRQVVTLRFYGKMFCDSGANGPYTLRNFAYMNVAKMPGPRSDVVKNAHTTGEYDAKQFTCTGFGDENFLAKAKTLEKEAAAEQR